MCCGEFIVKYILILANLLFTLLGIASIGIGIFIALNITQFYDALPVVLYATPISLIVLGAVVFLISFFGCCGAFKKNRCYLITYAVFVSILAIAKIYCAIMVFWDVIKMEDLVEEWITTAFNDTNTFGALETIFKCCGTTGPESYTCNLSETCCSCPINNTCLTEVAYEGCIPTITNYLTTFGGSTGGALVIIIFVEIIAVTLASCLAEAIKTRKQAKANKDKK